ncbi:MAG TPA: hypothetical protein DCQ94_07415 [Nitrospira sp.]|nr:hypothetical protein [Nitrospira sp.]
MIATNRPQVLVYILIPVLLLVFHGCQKTRWNKNIELYSPRIVDLSGIDIRTHSANVNSVPEWATQVPVGIAAFEAKNGQFLVFPLCKSQDCPLVTLEANELPPPSPKLKSIFQKGESYEFKSCGAGEIRIRVDSSSNEIGEISLRLERDEGEPFELRGIKQYLY